MNKQIEKARQALHRKYAMRASTKIINSIKQSDKMGEADLNNILKEQTQSFIDYLDNLKLLEYLEKSFEEQDINVLFDTTELEQTIGKLFK